MLGLITNHFLTKLHEIGIGLGGDQGAVITAIHLYNATQQSGQVPKESGWWLISLFSFIVLNPSCLIRQSWRSKVPRQAGILRVLHSFLRFGVPRLINHSMGRPWESDWMAGLLLDFPRRPPRKCWRMLPTLQPGHGYQCNNHVEGSQRQIYHAIE